MLIHTEDSHGELWAWFWGGGYHTETRDKDRAQDWEKKNRMYAWHVPVSEYRRLLSYGPLMRDGVAQQLREIRHAFNV